MINEYSFFGLQRVTLVHILKISFLWFSGFGGSIGLGIYVLITYVARQVAGPAVVLSALIAAVTAALSGMLLCTFTPNLKKNHPYLYTFTVQVYMYILIPLKP